MSHPLLQAFESLSKAPKEEEEEQPPAGQQGGEQLPQQEGDEESQAVGGTDEVSSQVLPPMKVRPKAGGLGHRKYLPFYM